MFLQIYPKGLYNFNKLQYKQKTLTMRMRPSSHDKFGLDRTMTSWSSIDNQGYLAQLNYNLVNEINQSQQQKYFYKNKLAFQNRNHANQLTQAFRAISEKNSIMIAMQEKIEHLEKDYRVLSDEYIFTKNNLMAQKEYLQKQMKLIKDECEKKIRIFQEQAAKDSQAKIAKRVKEVQIQCEQRIKLYQQQNDQLSENSRKLAHQLKLLQEDYRDMMIKNDTLIQESINRQLRKRDFESQDIYLRDVAQYDSIKKQNRQLKQRIRQLEEYVDLKAKQINRLKTQLQAEITKRQNIEKALQFESDKYQQILSEKYCQKAEYQTNTQQPFVPIIMPIDTNLMAEIVSLKQFVAEKIIERFSDFFCKAATTDPKKKSHSLITFKNSLAELKATNPENQIIIFIYFSLDKMIKLYCPALAYKRQFLTIKDQFIRNNLIQCETISNISQKLYRLLQLVHRLKHPINHLHSQISTGELRLVEIKVIQTLKKILC